MIIVREADKNEEMLNAPMPASSSAVMRPDDAAGVLSRGKLGALRIENRLGAIGDTDEARLVASASTKAGLKLSS